VWKVAAFWVLSMPVLGLRVLMGDGMRLALWIPNRPHRPNTQALVIRCCMFAVGAAMIFVGWTLRLSAAYDVTFIAVGSLLEVTSLYIPDFAFYVSEIVDQLLRKPR
jgi:hypothetical protein